MTRLVVGPFNRVEGDLEVALDIADGAVRDARVTTPLYRGFEQILLGRPAADALAIAPRICGICSLSQSLAAVAALRAAGGVAPEHNGVLAANIAHAAENIADHVTHFVLFFMPDFARPQYARQPWHAAVAARFAAVSGSAAAEMLPARARLLHVMGLIAGKWPHSLAFQPGGTTRALDLGARVRLLAIVRDFRAFIERTILGVPLDEFLDLATPQALAAYAERTEGDFPAFLRLAADTGCDRLGAGPGPLASFGAYHGAVQGAGGPLFAAGVGDATGVVRPLDAARIAEDVSHAWMRPAPPAHPARGTTEPDADRADAYSFAKAPRLDGLPVEVGALARQAVDGQRLIRAVLAQDGGSRVSSRILARMVETARLLPAMEGWARALEPGAPFCAPAGAAPPDGAAPDGAGAGLVEAARGALGHWIAVRGGRIAQYQIIAPTTWNFSPRDAAGIPGPLEQALVGTPVGAEGGASVAVQHVVRSFDPCMVCTAH